MINPAVTSKTTLTIAMVLVCSARTLSLTIAAGTKPTMVQS